MLVWKITLRHYQMPHHTNDYEKSVLGTSATPTPDSHGLILPIVLAS